MTRSAELPHIPSAGSDLLSWFGKSGCKVCGRSAITCCCHARFGMAAGRGTDLHLRYVLQHFVFGLVQHKCHHAFQYVLLGVLAVLGPVWWDHSLGAGGRSSCLLSLCWGGGAVCQKQNRLLKCTKIWLLIALSTLVIWFTCKLRLNRLAVAWSVLQVWTDEAEDEKPCINVSGCSDFQAFSAFQRRNNSIDIIANLHLVLVFFECFLWVTDRVPAVLRLWDGKQCFARVTLHSLRLLLFCQHNQPSLLLLTAPGPTRANPSQISTRWMLSAQGI